MVRLLVDRAVWDGSAQALPVSWLDGFHVTTFAADRPDELTAGLSRADALLLRSVTHLTAEILGRAKDLRAVATLSSGVDHMDPDDLATRGVRLFTGHGGNALAVADWVAWALHRLWGTSLKGKRILVVGVGAVGSAVATRLQTQGAVIVPCDPPRAEREPGFASMDLADALSAGGLDAVTLHVPLEHGGRHPTLHLLDRSRLQRLAGAVVLNSARGGVLDEESAAFLRTSGHLAGLAIDTWKSEPRPQLDVILACDLATPHIAGHSIEGKLQVAARSVAGLRTFVGLPADAVDLATAVRESVQIRGAHAALEPFAALDRATAAFHGTAALRQSGQVEASLFRTQRHDHARVETAGDERPLGSFRTCEQSLSLAPGSRML
jgi:phosphoglycerate dehydrogenase-like enzyme